MEEEVYTLSPPPGVNIFLCMFDQFSNQSLMQRLTAVEYILTVMALVLYSGGPLNVILSDGYSQGEMQIAEPDYALTSLFFRLTYLLFAALLFSRWKTTIRALPASFVVIPLVGLAALSYLWSAFPGETLSSTITLIATTLFGIYIAVRYTPKQQLILLGWAFGTIVILSFTYALALPKYGIMGGVHAGTWRGIYTHKNTLGRMMTLSGTVFTLLLLGDRKNRILPAVFLGLSVLLILLTTSVAALVNLGIMLFIVGLCQILRTQYKWLVILAGSIGLLIGSALVAAAFNYETIVVDILEKDPTLTGRTNIWLSALDVIKAKPWLGYGYEAFWHGMEGPSAYIWREVMWPAPDAHNGYIELTLHLGIIGLTLFLVGYLINIVRSCMTVRQTSGSEFVWPLTYLAFILIANIPEQTLLKSNTIFWVLYVATTVTLFMPRDVDSEPSPKLTYYNAVGHAKYKQSYQATKAARRRRTKQPSGTRGVLETDR